MQPQDETTGASSTASGFKPLRRVSGLTWILIGIGVLFALGWMMSAMRKQPDANSRPATVTETSSYVGLSRFSNAPDGGVTFNDVYPPGSPADKAGLVGGDIITGVNGHALRDEAQMRELLRQTPVGKTLEVIYVRDGETRKTQLTTISEDQFNQLDEAFANRPEGQGQLGFDDGRTRVVPIEGTKISGVQLNDISSSGPAALAGIVEGDIIIEFDRVPIRRLGELVMRVRRAIPYSTVKVVVMRGSERLEISVKMGKRG